MSILKHSLSELIGGISILILAIEPYRARPACTSSITHAPPCRRNVTVAGSVRGGSGRGLAARWAVLFSNIAPWRGRLRSSMTRDAFDGALTQDLELLGKQPCGDFFHIRVTSSTSLADIADEYLSRACLIAAHPESSISLDKRDFASAAWSLVGKRRRTREERRVVASDSSPFQLLKTRLRTSSECSPLGCRVKNSWRILGSSLPRTLSHSIASILCAAVSESGLFGYVFLNCSVATYILAVLNVSHSRTSGGRRSSVLGGSTGLGASATVAGGAVGLAGGGEGGGTSFSRRSFLARLNVPPGSTRRGISFGTYPSLVSLSTCAPGAIGKRVFPCAVPIGRPSSKSCVCGIAPDNTKVAGSGSSRNEIRCSVPLLTATLWGWDFRTLAFRREWSAREREDC